MDVRGVWRSAVGNAWEDFDVEYFPGNWYQCYDKLGDGCSIDFEYPVSK